ncbi:MAG: hypothetical protein WCA49_06155, partial [Candidatus Sulfotelmatobacter sp.]
MQMIQDTGLALSDSLSSFVLPHMLTMAGEKDGWISIQKTSDSRVYHTWQRVAKCLTCQTKTVLPEPFGGQTNAIQLKAGGQPHNLGNFSPRATHASLDMYM